MVVSEEQLQKKNVSRETMPDTSISNVSRETIVKDASDNSSEILTGETVSIGDSGALLSEKKKLDVSRETSVENTEKLSGDAEKAKLNTIKAKIQFCRQISQLDPRRCSLLLEEILDEI